MNASEALEASILHWQENVAAETPSDVKLGPESCALCCTFPDSDCHGCLVSKFTGREDCGGSPYIKAVDAFRNWQKNLTPASAAAWRAAAQAELDFLILLREPTL